MFPLVKHFIVPNHFSIKCANRKQNDYLGGPKDKTGLNLFTIVKYQKDYSGVLLVYEVCVPKVKYKHY